jgi:hypothetical protein
MQALLKRLSAIDQHSLTNGMHENGYMVLPNILTDDQCNEVIGNYGQPNLYRKTILMERYRFGLGEYKYFNYPLPKIIALLRETIYPILVPIANQWMKVLGLPLVFPASHQELLQLCNKNGQTKPTPLILKYLKGGFNTLHQDLYGEVFFPIQMVVFLNEPGNDFTGGEFVLTQQNIRAQSKAIVLQPKKGDILIFTTNYRPVKGTKGYYRASMKHGVSEVKSGERHTLGIIFHDALT